MGVTAARRRRSCVSSTPSVSTGGTASRPPSATPPSTRTWRVPCSSRSPAAEEPAGGPPQGQRPRALPRRRPARTGRRDGPLSVERRQDLEEIDKGGARAGASTGSTPSAVPGTPPRPEACCRTTQAWSSWTATTWAGGRRPVPGFTQLPTTQQRGCSSACWASPRRRPSAHPHTRGTRSWRPAVPRA